MNEIYSEIPFQDFCDNAHKNGLDPIKCKSFLIDVKNILDDSGINYFLLFGTLLGAYRDNNFIEYDKDIDIGIFDESEKKLKKIIADRIFLKKGIKVFRNRNYSFCRDGIYLDIYPFMLDGEEFRSKLGFIYNYRLNKKYFPLQKINFLGESFSTISNIEDYLLEKYGENWEKKIRNKFASS